MSLLRRTNEEVTVFPEVKFTDADGNPFSGPSEEGLSLRVMIQPQPQSGTSSRRAENPEEGFQTETVYRMRVHQDWDQLFGAQSRIEWKGKYWAIIGDPLVYNGSPRTRHVDYTIRRS